MVKQHARKHVRAEIITFFQYIVPDKRVSFDFLIFLIGELAGLDDDIVVDVGLADIVEQPRHDNLLRFLGRKPDFPTHACPEHRHAQTVFICIVIIVLQGNHLVREKIRVSRDIGDDIVGDIIDALNGLL